MDKKNENIYLYFCYLEKEMQMFDLKYKSIPYWQLIRFYLLRIITTNNTEKNIYKQKKSYLKLLYYNIKNAIIQKGIYSQIEQADVLTIRPERVYPSRTKIKEREFDYANLEEIYKIANILSLGEYSEQNKLRFYDLSIPELKVVFWKLKRKILGVKNILIDDEEILKNFIDKINSHYRLEVFIEDVCREIEYCIKVFEEYCKEYRKLYDKIKPKIILVSTYYDDHIFPAIFVAKQMGIPIVELQHGRINNHDAYWYEDVECEGKILPDYLFIYGEWWKKEIKLPKCTRIIITGYPFLETQINEIDKNKNNIVLSVFSGPMYGRCLSEFIVDNIAVLKKNNIEIIYKLHPTELGVWEASYPWLKNCNGIRIVGNEKNSYEILNESDIVLSINSTVMYEAAVYQNLKIAILDKDDYSAMIPLINMGYGELVGSIDELIEMINNENEIREIKEEIFRLNSADLFREEVKKIIASNHNDIEEIQ